MNNYIKMLATIGILLLNTITYAETADLSVNIEPRRVELVNGDNFGEIAITVINNGPDGVGFDLTNNITPAVSPPIIYPDPTTGLTPVGFLRSDDPSECFLVAGIIEPVPGGQPGFFYRLFFPPMLANTSTTCIIRFESFFDSDPFSLDWRVINSDTNDSDPDLSNNSQWVFFGLRPPVVPLLSFWSIIVMTLVLMLLSYHRLNASFQGKNT